MEIKKRETETQQKNLSSKRGGVARITTAKLRVRQGTG